MTILWGISSQANATFILQIWLHWPAFDSRNSNIEQFVLSITTCGVSCALGLIPWIVILFYYLKQLNDDIDFNKYSWWSLKELKTEVIFTISRKAIFWISSGSRCPLTSTTSLSSTRLVDTNNNWLIVGSNGWSSLINHCFYAISLLFTWFLWGLSQV